MKEVVCQVDDLAVDEIKPVKVNDEALLLIRLEDGFYATQARCTHLFKSMHNGKVVDGNIQCPLHKAQFCIKSGEVQKWANFPPGIQLLNAVRGEKALKTYPVSVEGSDVSIEV